MSELGDRARELAAELDAEVELNDQVAENVSDVERRVKALAVDVTALLDRVTKLEQLRLPPEQPPAEVELNDQVAENVSDVERRVKALAVDVAALLGWYRVTKLEQLRLPPEQRSGAARGLLEVTWDE